jgi:hypothetical protein
MTGFVIYDVNEIPASELLPVKRTVKNQKIMATSNRNVAGCFLGKQTLFHRVCNERCVSGFARDDLLFLPRRKAAIKRVSTPAGEGKGFPCHFVKCCPAFGQRTVT